MENILTDRFPNFPWQVLSKMIEFNYKLAAELDSHKFGHKGAPWECNLRDLTRWCEATLYQREQSLSAFLSPERTAQLIYSDRMRSREDKIKVQELFQQVMGYPIEGFNPVGYVAKKTVHFGDVTLQKEQDQPNEHVQIQGEGRLVLRGQLGTLRSLTYCVNQNWMAILVRFEYFKVFFVLTGCLGRSVGSGKDQRC